MEDTSILQIILTCSAQDYLKSVKRDLSEYDLRGIHFYMEFNELKTDVNFQEQLVKQVPVNCEVIVDYKFCAFSAHSGYIGRHETFIASGTALILKAHNK